MANETNETNKTKSFIDAMKFIQEIFDSFKKTIHNGNVERGFYDKEPSNCEQLALIMTEGAEAIEADRKDKHADLATFDQEVLKLDANDPDFNDKLNELFRTYIKDTVEDELADIFIRLMDYCGWRDIDITQHVILKINYNKTRPYKHGKQY